VQGDAVELHRRLACVVGDRASMAGQPEHISADWPRRRAALRLIWRWRGVSKLECEWAEASGRLSSAWGCAELLVSELDKGKGVAARDGGGGAGRPQDGVEAVARREQLREERRQLDLRRLGRQVAHLEWSSQWSGVDVSGGG
jgi:hypothetical protein